jgi:hypothetical protein
MSDSDALAGALGASIPVYGATSKIVEGIAEKSGLSSSDAKIVGAVAGVAASAITVATLGTP